MMLDRPKFTTTRFRWSYVMSDVDGFLDEAEYELGRARPADDLVERIRGSRFAPVRIRLGYDMGEVDAYLDKLEALAREALGH